ncbi:MAG: prolyl oligopeptidase family serine peptidase, partial [Treponema sp.]|nr:prolyl oligopeptidase family serine peptidase [Treponema sp.]
SYSHPFMMMKKQITVREETIEDAVTAAGLLRSDGRIDAERIFIVGHSMGAMLAPRIDAEGGNFRGLIMMAG